MVSALEIAMHDIQEEVTNKKDETPRWSDIVERAVECKFEKATVELNEAEKSIEEMKKKTLDIKDKKNRRNNIILFKVPECQPGSYEEVMKHDEEFCLKFCNDILDSPLDTRKCTVQHADKCKENQSNGGYSE